MVSVLGVFGACDFAAWKRVAALFFTWPRGICIQVLMGDSLPPLGDDDPMYKDSGGGSSSHYLDPWKIPNIQMKPQSILNNRKLKLTCVFNF